MKFLTLLLVFIFLVSLTTVFLVVSPPPNVFASHSRVDLLSTDNFAVLAGTTITGTNTNVVTGDVGLDPGGGASITLLTCAEMASGTIYDNDVGYAGGGGGSTACRTTNAGLLTTAKNDLITVYNDAAGRTAAPDIATELGGTTLTDGTYHAASGMFEITGTLTLNGEGNADAVFIFKMGTTLTTASSSQVVLTNGAQACNVYWQVGSSATLGTSTTLRGNILALTTITDTSSSTVYGRLLARNGAVTLNNTTVTRQTCATPTPTPTPTSVPGQPTSTPTPTSTSTSTASSTSSSGGSSSPLGAKVCPTLGYIAPIIIESRRVDGDSIFLSWGPYSGVDTFKVYYGLTNGNWLYNTNVTGFSTTLNDLPPNQPIWIQIAATDGCSVGDPGEAKLVGEPSLPYTGIGPDAENTSRNIIIVTSFALFVATSLVVILKKPN